MVADVIGPQALVKPGSRLELAWRSVGNVAQNLALDDQLVSTARERARSVLRFWWGGPPAIVLGSSERSEETIDEEACRRLGVSVLKRASGGGTVLQTSDVMNYSLVAPAPARLDITGAFRLGARLICSILDRFDIEATFEGTSDVAVDGRKISGNAQAWRHRALLLHGTLLVDFDYDLAEQVLRHPAREPAYRRGRTHRDFLTTLRELGVDADRETLEEEALRAARAVFPDVRLTATSRLPA